jgi:hypothetical protein
MGIIENGESNVVQYMQSGCFLEPFYLSGRQWVDIDARASLGAGLPIVGEGVGSRLEGRIRQPKILSIRSMPMMKPRQAIAKLEAPESIDVLLRALPAARRDDPLLSAAGHTRTRITMRE